MKILIIQNGDVADIMVTTALIKKLLQCGSVQCISNENGQIFKYINGVMIQYLPLVNLDNHYDIAINLHPDPVGGSLMNVVNATQKFGYGFDGEHIVFLNKASDIHYRATKLGVPTESNIFQMLFGITGLKWEGESYECNYFPRNRQKKYLTGICVKNSTLRDYLTSNLAVNGQVVRVPFKQNILKQFDEINKCKRLITDDEGCYHVGLSLLKHVEYIIKREPPYRLEMFNSGNYHIFNLQGDHGK